MGSNQPCSNQAHTPSTVLQNKDKYIFVQAPSCFRKSVLDTFPLCLAYIERPTMQKTGPASSSLHCRPLRPWTCCLQSLWVPTLLPSLRGCQFTTRFTDPGVPRLPSTPFHCRPNSLQWRRLDWQFSLSHWTAAVCVTVRTWPLPSGTRRLLWSSRRSLRSRPVRRERLPLDLIQTCTFAPIEVQCFMTAK